MKKFVLILFLAMMMIFSNQQAHARDIYIGTSNATGWDCYVMTETINITRRDDNGYLKNFDVTLKMITSSRKVLYLDYSFERHENASHDITWYFVNSQGFQGKVDVRNTPIEYNLWEYVLDNYRNQ